MDVMAAARRVWEYHQLGHALERADCLLALGSNDVRVAHHAARLMLEGWAPLLVLSGGLGNFTLGNWTKPEAEIFLDIVIEAGVPRDRVMVENKSTNSGENISFTRKLLLEAGLEPASFILVQKPFMERRAYATFMKAWPGKRVIVTSPDVSFEAYPNTEIPLDALIATMVGDLQRVMIYPRLGYQIHQDIPQDVVDAFDTLVAAGYTSHLLPGPTHGT